MFRTVTAGRLCNFVKRTPELSMLIGSVGREY